MKPQKQRILNYLSRGYKLTPLQALDKFDCWALSSRISDLNKLGHNIHSELVKTKSGKHVARYYMLQKLDMPIKNR